MFFCTRKVCKGQFNKHKYVTMGSLKYYSVESFLSCLVNADWILVFTSNDVNDSWVNFKNIL